MRPIYTYFDFRNEAASETQVRYSSSLVPKFEILKKIKNIVFKSTYSTNADHIKNRISLENEVNTHIYKPVYRPSDSNETLDCFVATEEIMLHTLKHLSKICSFLNVELYVSTEINVDKSSVSNIIQDWTIHKNIIFGNLPSILNFLSYKILLDSNSISRNEFQTVSSYLEMKKLDVTLNCSEELLELAEKTRNELIISEQNSTSFYLRSTNIRYKNHDITLIQLPWGSVMAYEVVQSLVQKQNQFDFVGIAGGIGYNGKDLDVDDCYFPNEVNDPYTGNKIIITPAAFDKESNFYKNSKIGSLCTLRPTLNVTHMVNHANQSFPDKITAVDMEASKLLPTLIKNSKSITLGYYVMDIDSEGKRFGDTYYSYDFLNKLYANPNRGKYFVFDTVFNHFN